MSRAITCYLAGPITGESFDSATTWREDFKTKLNNGIVGISPLRCKEYLDSEACIKDAYDGGQNGMALPLSTSRAITTRDYYDVMHCDMLVAYVKGAKIVSIGTVVEIAWAKAFNKPVVLIIENEGNIHEHSMIREAIGYRVDSLDGAIYIVNSFLTDYVEKQ